MKAYDGVRRAASGAGVNLRSAVGLLVLLALVAGGAYWLGARGHRADDPATAPAVRVDAPAPAEPAAPLAIGERVEALSADGWQDATITAIDGVDATVDYERADLADERLDLRLLRRVEAVPAPPAVGAPPDAADHVDDARGGSTLSALDGEYLGCFRDTSDLDLDGHLERSAENTPQRCVATCIGLGHAYAAVQYGESCLCGDRYGRYGEADNCDFACTGDPAQTCGGYSANAVYATGVTMPNPH